MTGTSTMGYINYNNVVDGKDGAHFFDNLGDGLWATIID